MPFNTSYEITALRKMQFGTIFNNCVWEKLCKEMKRGVINQQDKKNTQAM